MPKDTFYNLPQDKQKRIIEAAIDEFAAHSYHKARVTAVAKNAGISIGSYYQYFEDKKDLFKYIIDQTATKKINYINQDIMRNEEDYSFFEILRETYLSGMKFAKENPRLVAIGNKLLNNKELQQEIWQDQKDKSTDYFKNLLLKGQNNGEIDQEIDVELIARLLTGLHHSLVDIIYKDNKIFPENFANEMEIIDKMLYFIKNGLKKHS